MNNFFIVLIMQQDCGKNLNHFKSIKDKLICLAGIFSS